MRYSPGTRRLRRQWFLYELRRQLFDTWLYYALPRAIVLACVLAALVVHEVLRPF